MGELDAVFEAKEDLAAAVKEAMSETNSSKRLKFAVAERAEGDKILQVKAAEAEAEAKYYQVWVLLSSVKLSLMDSKQASWTFQNTSLDPRRRMLWICSSLLSTST